MANHPQQLEQLQLRTYSRTEFTALRARVKGLPLETIERLYFDRDAEDRVDVAQLLRTMRDDLVAAALRDGSPVLKSHLQAAIEKYGEPRLTPVSLQLIEQVAGQWAAARRRPIIQSAAGSDRSLPLVWTARGSARSARSSRW